MLDDQQIKGQTKTNEHEVKQLVSNKEGTGGDHKCLCVAIFGGGGEENALTKFPQKISQKKAGTVLG